MVRPGITFRTELLGSAPGTQVDLAPVLALSNGSKLQVGTPEISDAKVRCTVVEHVKDAKVISFKKKRRKGYKRKQGHRQRLTVLKVESI